MAKAMEEVAIMMAAEVAIIKAGAITTAVVEGTMEAEVEEAMEVASPINLRDLKWWILPQGVWLDW